MTGRDGGGGGSGAMTGRDGGGGGSGPMTGRDGGDSSAGGSASGGDASAPPVSSDLTGPFPNSAGASANLSALGSIDRTNAFFQSFGNGRACVSCHRPEDGFSLTPKTAQALFTKCGLDSDGPIPPMTQDERTACALFRTQRWLELAHRRRLDRSCTAQRVRALAVEGPHPPYLSGPCRGHPPFRYPRSA